MSFVELDVTIYYCNYDLRLNSNRRINLNILTTKAIIFKMERQIVFNASM